MADPVSTSRSGNTMFLFQEPYRLTDLIRVVANEIKENALKPTSRHDTPETEFCVHTKGCEELGSLDIVCYLDHGPGFTDDGEEVFPDFVVGNNLAVFSTESTRSLSRYSQENGDFRRFPGNISTVNAAG